MPPHHLTTLSTMEIAIAAVLTGTPVQAAALAMSIDAAAMTDAVEVYRQAGRRALDQHTDAGWTQMYVQFPDWDRAERTAVEHLAPLLRRADADGITSAWWFIRKHPCWRLRLRPGPAGHALTSTFTTALDELTARGHIDSWRPGIYEAETAAFGDQPSIGIAHELFCADSRAVLGLLDRNDTGLGRRELSLLLCCTLMRAARTEWYEQGDIWHRVTTQRPLPDDVPADKITAMVPIVRQTLLADTTPSGPLLRAHAPLAPITDWVEGFRTAGQAMARTAALGRLRRGLREIISYAIIFHWNRLGFAPRTQAILAQTACNAILGPAPSANEADAANSMKTTGSRST